MQSDGGRAGTHHDPTGTDAPSRTWQGCRPARSSGPDRDLGGGAARPGDGGAAEPARDAGGRSAGQGVSMVAGPDPQERAAAVALNLELSHGRHGASARIEIHEKASGRVALLALRGWLDGAAMSHLGRTLDDLALQGVGHLLLDCSQLDHIDYRMVPSLVERLERFESRSSLVVCGLSHYLRDLF